VSAAHDHLVSSLEAIRASLEAGDEEAVAVRLEAFGRAVQQVAGAGADARVVALFSECQGKAVAVLGRLQRELSGHATSARAAAAYGGER
jgi:hypothetical protein